MKKTAIGVILVFALALGLSLFYLMGGFNDIEVNQENLGQIELSGVHFQGTPMDESLKNAFLTIEDLTKENKGAKLHTIYFQEPAGKRDTMEVFVGIESKWTKNQENLIYLEFDGSAAIVAEIKSHRFVMPGPEKVKDEIREFAKNNQMEEPDLFIDQIIDSDLVRVIGIKNNTNP
ncbi:hypothetical protein [Shivajiella indica]|uniref:Bypass of forespore C C-terminal domain-containing protein n=1 Tax=Shivajiella indica TaxID=872115 RepID=A0ABW5B398_9BACT